VLVVKKALCDAILRDRFGDLGHTKW